MFIQTICITRSRECLRKVNYFSIAINLCCSQFMLRKFKYLHHIPTCCMQVVKISFNMRSQNSLHTIHHIFIPNFTILNFFNISGKFVLLYLPQLLRAFLCSSPSEARERVIIKFVTLIRSYTGWRNGSGGRAAALY